MKKSELSLLGAMAIEETTKDSRIPQRWLLIITAITTFKMHVKKEKKEEKKKTKIEYPFIFNVRYINH